MSSKTSSFDARISSSRGRIGFNRLFEGLQHAYENAIAVCLDHPVLAVSCFAASVVLSFAFFPLLGLAFFPRTDPGQFVVNVKVPPGTRIEVTDQYVAKMERDNDGNREVF